MARITLDTDGLRDVLKTEDMKRLVNEAAEKIADNVKQLDIRVEGVPGDIDLPVKVTTAPVPPSPSHTRPASPCRRSMER
jgi:hypothetical protein